ncbi:winged helix-turn-helix domain-containing protein [Shewanella amazonensis]|uniref:Putative transcriptional regulator, CadC n=1 Tax=Shewanella amazonensis (strain ATCC BAA-1098 / SB2B) TaxID=326297 RepID=A1S2M2_SHEAM|nr:winged helix-turn-helix domain-containing protein [Shewanella amazonensis]ABL98628.1 putative transcriptional regulator, CadC [Shewanella amazonensis SB2B]
MIYSLYPLTLDVQGRSLTYKGCKLQCDERTLMLFQLLIESYPEPLETSALLEKLWPNTVVSSWSVTRLISDARKLLKDAGMEESVIQTLHGRGYRLEPELAAKLQSHVQDSNTGAVRVPKTRPLAWAALAASLLVAAIVQYVGQSPQGLLIGEPANVKGRILWVDDHPENNTAEIARLRDANIAVYTTLSTEEALMLLSMYRYDAVISDMGRSDDSLAGLKLVESLRQSGDQTPFFLYTILPSDAQRQLVLEHGAQGVAVDETALFALLERVNWGIKSTAPREDERNTPLTKTDTSN